MKPLTDNSSLEIAVLGAGNVGCALAGVLTSRGYRVNLYSDPAHSSKIDFFKESKEIQLEGTFSGSVKLNHVTTSLKEAIASASIILIALPAYAQEPMIQQLDPYLSRGQILVFLPGSFASLIAKEIIYKKGLTFVDATSIPFPCRQVTNGVVTVLTPKKSLDISVFPLRESAKIKDILSRILEIEIHAYPHPLQAGLSNANGIVHPATAILNLGRIEDEQGDFYFYRQGMTESVCKILQKIEDDRMEIGHRLGLNLKPFLQIAYDFYGLSFSSIREFATQTKLHNSVKACPTTIQDRYFTEDIPFVLVPWYYIGKLVGIDSLAMRSIIDLGSLLHHQDFLKTGRNLVQMGMQKMNTLELKEWGA